MPFSELTPRTGADIILLYHSAALFNRELRIFVFFWQFAFLMQKQHPRISFSCRGSTSYFFTPAERLIVTFKFFIVGRPSPRWRNPGRCPNSHSAIPFLL